jgi:hypothetical protein
MHPKHGKCDKKRHLTYKREKLGEGLKILVPRRYANSMGRWHLRFRHLVQLEPHNRE